jgi:hypothetical protein
MEFLNQGLEVIGRAKTIVELAEVLDPVAMICFTIRGTGTIIILIHRTDPY